MKPVIDQSGMHSKTNLPLKLTLKRREASVQDELEVTKLTLIEDNGGQLLGLCNEFLATRSITSNEILEDTT
jgi:hypothetical protein